MVNEMNVTELIDGQYKDYSKYVLYSRAIPHMIDGLKPSQRKILYTALKTANTSRIKTASLSGNTISQANYHHGDASLNDAITKMVQLHSNNIPLLEGEGSFGSRLVPDAAAPRYTYVKMSQNFEKYFADTMVADKSIDPEDPEPAFYLPIIPWVLVNGVKGIAVGFATDIQPRNPKEIAKLCQAYLKGKNIDKETLLPYYPEFEGKIYEELDSVYCEGNFTLTGQTKLEITEVPVGFTRESYVQVLNKLEETGKIVSYTDKCDKTGFKFDVTLKRGKKMKDHQIVRLFKLKKKINENITVIDHEGKLKVYDSPIDIIKEFCDYRLGKYEERYEYLIEEGISALDIIKAKVKFIELIIQGTLDFKNKNRKTIKKELSTTFKPDIIEILIKMPIYSLCQDEMSKYINEGTALYKQIENWRIIDTTKEFIKELKV
ncbi:MAG: DNA gyrase subunit A [Candidatus Pacebacteria bacterium]|nr:DNA gyrase subunit A [Candidatus Paceibacterota bacterium]